VSIILVTGSTGLLGSSLVPFLRSSGLEVVAHAHSQKADLSFDLSSKTETFSHLDGLKPSTILNLVGLTSIETCEEHPNTAYSINTRTVENIASWIRKRGGCHLVHVSTDQVYDGLGPHPEEPVTLTNTYALTKYAGELAASRVASTVLRTNFVGRSANPNRESLSDWVYNSMRQGRAVQVVEDVLFSPLSIRTLSSTLLQVLSQKPEGIYNLGSREGMSKADFNLRLAERMNLPTETMARVKRSDCAFFKAYRPGDMRMDSSLIEDALGITLPTLHEEIKLIADEYIP
jgi:dTDP-4-dehydrorhamnose reductase